MIIKYKLMIILFLILIQSSTLLVYSQILDIGPKDANTESTVTVLIGYNSPITLSNITTDITNQDYINATQCDTPTKSPMTCIITLNNRSQTEQYTFHYKNSENGPIFTFPKVITLSNKYNLKLSQPKPTSKSILNINLLYGMPYDGQYYSSSMMVNISNLGNIKTFDSDINGTITIIDSTNFQIELDNSVGNIDVKIKYSDSANIFSLQSNYEKPIISSITNDENKCTINGDNFGLSIFQGYTHITLDPLISHSLLIPDYINYNNTQIEFNYNYLYTSEVEFNVSVSGISLNQTFKHKFRPIINSINSIPVKGGDITINGYFLNDQRNDQNKTSSNITVMIGNKKCESPSNLIKGDYTSIKCTINTPGLESDKDLTISITIDNITNQETTIRFNYNIPSIVSINIKDNNIELYGENLNNGKVFFNGEYRTLTYVNPSSNPKLELLDHFTNDFLYFQAYNNQTSNQIYIKLIPEIKLITSENGNMTIVSDGSVIRITGRFLNLARFNRNPTIHKLIDDDDDPLCNFYKQYNSSTIECTPVFLKSLESYVVMFSIDDELSNSFVISVVKPQEMTSTPTKGKDTSEANISNLNMVVTLVVVGLVIAVGVVITIYLVKRYYKRLGTRRTFKPRV